MLKNFSAFNLELFHNELKNTPKVKKSYNDTIKQFALTLYSYLPKAYNFVRSKLNLPHQITLLSNWKWIGESYCEADLVIYCDFCKFSLIFLNKIV